MSNVKKLMMTAAGGGGPLNVEDVFSTYLYQGSGSTNQSITNGIDLSTNGGLVWIAGRTAGANHYLVDTERGALNFLSSNLTVAEDTTTSTGVNAFNTDGFDVDGVGAIFNSTAYKYASWTFRKAPKFFDVVTYTGNGTAGRTISHNLGSEPGVIMVKRTNNNGSWNVYHRSLGNTKALVLNANDTAYTSADFWNNTSPTSSVFSVGNSLGLNGNGDEYVAYLFAHNDGDGEFGLNADQDIIKCGSYTGNGDSNGPEIDLGFEPQWIMIKEATSVSGNGSWWLADKMRGADEKGYAYMRADSVAYENSLTNPYITIRNNGFKIQQNDNTLNENAQTYVYIAIRNGPMAVPESATDVFNVVGGNSSTPTFNAGFPVDMAFYRATSSDNTQIGSRLTGIGRMYTNVNNAEGTNGAFTWDDNSYWASTYSTSIVKSWMWRRAPNFFDVVTYTGNGTAGRTVSHNLGVTPEMMWVKSRNVGRDWQVYHTGLNGGTTPEDYYIRLHLNNPETNAPTWNDTAPTATSFTVGSTGNTNGTNEKYIGYLFASLDGISKVGSYTGTGSVLNVDCGFTNGARFVLIKNTGNYNDWVFFDTERGIVSGNDSKLELNTTDGEVTGYDYIDPYSSGFTVNPISGDINTSGNNYIFYAIAA